MKVAPNKLRQAGGSQVAPDYRGQMALHQVSGTSSPKILSSSFYGIKYHGKTFLAGGSNLVEGLSLDGMDQGGVLRGEGVARDNILLDVYTGKDSHDGQWVRAYR